MSYILEEFAPRKRRTAYSLSSIHSMSVAAEDTEMKQKDNENRKASTKKEYTLHLPI